MLRTRCCTVGLRGWALRLVLAYVLLLQGVLGAMAATAHAVAAADAAGGRLCAPSRADGDPPAGAPHADLCCTLGCAAAQPAPAVVPTALRLPPPPQVRAAEPRTAAPAGPAEILAAFEARGPPLRR
ncbi:hypothetical protein [Aquabacter spiritensis]|uniref:DUF2946 family protein n=1 Tax=Aquabacter spiritensis TaxID=933073 RepID=A0A4R3M906_9HYPH|nr:hypothetical protein [Aquabacter spiritensis]TCT08167.1 hypothetical protein EDC64_101689 [Aquabacter spiritensis]